MVGETAPCPLCRLSCFDYKKTSGVSMSREAINKPKQREQQKTKGGGGGAGGESTSEAGGRKREGERQKGIERVRVNEAWSCIYPN